MAVTDLLIAQATRALNESPRISRWAPQEDMRVELRRLKKGEGLIWTNGKSIEAYLPAQNTILLTNMGYNITGSALCLDDVVINKAYAHLSKSLSEPVQRDVVSRTLALSPYSGLGILSARDVADLAQYK